MGDYLSIGTAASVLGVSEQTIRREIARGKLQAVKIGRIYRIPEMAFREYRKEISLSA